MAKARKPAITNLARPEGVIDDVVGPLGKKAVGRVRQSVRRAVKAQNRYFNVAGAITKSSQRSRAAVRKNFNMSDLAKEEFARADLQARMMAAGNKGTYRGQARGARAVVQTNTVPRSSELKYYKAFHEEKRAMAARKAKRAAARTPKKK
jgi:hypothetical protein